MTKSESELEYAGFWIRLEATLIDGIIVLVVTLPILFSIYGSGYLTSEKFLLGPMDFFLNYVAPAIFTIVFWVYKSATPGKIIVHAKIVDAKTGKKPTLGQFVGRYLAYYLSAIPLGLGYIWVAFDPKKQGWHDKLAGTVVVRMKTPVTKKVVFSGDE